MIISIALSSESYRFVQITNNPQAHNIIMKVIISKNRVCIKNKNLTISTKKGRDVNKMKKYITLLFFNCVQNLKKHL